MLFALLLFSLIDGCWKLVVWYWSKIVWLIDSCTTLLEGAKMEQKKKIQKPEKTENKGWYEEKIKKKKCKY